MGYLSSYFEKLLMLVAPETHKIRILWVSFFRVGSTDIKMDILLVQILFITLQISNKIQSAKCLDHFAFCQVLSLLINDIDISARNSIDFKLK